MSLVAVFLAATPAPLTAQDLVSLLPPMEWRSIGPDRGGRSIAVAGHPERPFEYYFGATGGGLFKTTDGGTTWIPVTDGQVASASVGAVAMAPSDPDIVYIGMGEVQLRANVLQGDGVYRSDDGGTSWRHLGLTETHAIGRIRIHPTDPDRLYVAALGHPFGPNPERGVYRTRDGGRTWEKVLFRDERTGAVMLNDSRRIEEQRALRFAAEPRRLAERVLLAHARDGERLAGEPGQQKVMLGDVGRGNVPDVLRHRVVEPVVVVRQVGLAGVLVDFAREHALAAQRVEAASQAADPGKEVDETELWVAHSECPSRASWHKDARGTNVPSRRATTRAPAVPRQPAHPASTRLR